MGITISVTRPSRLTVWVLCGIAIILLIAVGFWWKHKLDQDAAARRAAAERARIAAIRYTVHGTMLIADYWGEAVAQGASDCEFYNGIATQQQADACNAALKFMENLILKPVHRVDSGGGFSDLTDGAPVQALDGNGDVLGQGELYDGTTTINGTVFKFKVSGLKRTDFYTFDIGSRHAMSSFGQLQAESWNANYSIGPISDPWSWNPKFDAAIKSAQTN